MKKNYSCILHAAFCITLLTSILPATAAEVGDVVDLTPVLKGKVLKVKSGTNHYVEVYANPANKPEGRLQIKYSYHIGDDVFIPERIADNAFERLELKEVELPVSVVSVGKNAFYGCTHLASVSHAEPSEFHYIGDYAFAHTGSLTSFPFEGIYSIASFAFLSSGLKKAELPEITVIESGAFQQCRKLEKVVVGKGCASIGGIAFSQCDRLKEVTLNEGLETIGSTAFAFSLELNDVLIPSTVKEVGTDAFSGSAVKRVFILSESFMESCDRSALLAHTGITAIYAPAGMLAALSDYLEKGSEDHPAESLATVKPEPLEAIVAVEPVKGAEGKFTLTKKLDGITGLKVVDADGNAVAADNKGAYPSADGKATLEYTLDGFLNFHYTVEVKAASGSDTPSGVVMPEASADADYEYFTLQGIRIDVPMSGSIVVRRDRTSGKTEKIRVR